MGACIFYSTTMYGELQRLIVKGVVFEGIKALYK